jgi:hypothetical protein
MDIHGQSLAGCRALNLVANDIATSIRSQNKSSVSCTTSCRQVVVALGPSSTVLQATATPWRHACATGTPRQTFGNHAGQLEGERGDGVSHVTLHRNPPRVA